MLLPLFPAVGPLHAIACKRAHACFASKAAHFACFACKVKPYTYQSKRNYITLHTGLMARMKRNLFSLNQPEKGIISFKPDHLELWIAVTTSRSGPEAAHWQPYRLLKLAKQAYAAFFSVVAAFTSRTNVA